MYIRRRQEQSIEIQQMRYFEEQQQKVGQNEPSERDTMIGLFQEKKRIFTRERQLRLQAEQRRDEIAGKLMQYQQQMKEIHETLVSR